MPDAPELLASLLPLVKALRALEEDAATAEGIRMWQYAVLSVAQASPGITQGRAAAVMDYSANRIVADIDDLEAQGLLTRSPGEDRRAYALHVTEAGRRVRARVHRAIRAGEDELLSGLSATRREQLRRTLGAIRPAPAGSAGPRGRRAPRRR